MVAAVHENNVTTDGIVTYCPGLKLLLTKKPKLDHQDIKGCVPLIQAINLNRPYAVKLLVSVISFFSFFFFYFSSAQNCLQNLMRCLIFLLASGWCQSKLFLVSKTSDSITSGCSVSSLQFYHFIMEIYLSFIFSFYRSKSKLACM